MGFSTIQEAGAAAGSGGDWQDDLGTGAEIDGVASFKAVSAPSATADYAKLYAQDSGHATSTYKLVLNCDGADASYEFKDSSQSNHLVTAHYGAQVETSVQKYGTGSLKMDGANDYLSIPYSQDFDFGSASFTVHCWYYPTASVSDTYIMSINYETSSGSNYSQCLLEGAHGGGSAMRVSAGSYDGGGAQYTAYSSDIALNTWHHIAAVKNGDVLTCYVNGVANGSPQTMSGALVNSNNGILIGKRAVGTHAACHLDDIVIVKGTALWTSNFDTALPGAATTVASATLWAQDEQGNDTRLSPHNPKTGAWEFYSKNQKTGRVVRIDMESVVEDLGQLTGKNYIKDE